MDKRIIYTRADGGLSIIIPAPAARLKDETDDAFIARIMEKDVPASALNVRVVDAADIPTDRTFRDAWDDLGEALGVNMTKARKIHMSRIRAVRDDELKRLDVEQLKGANVAGQKQALRDLPQTFDLTTATTPAALDALWPAGLPRP